jgi:hypothetical protein
LEKHGGLVLGGWPGVGTCMTTTVRQVCRAVMPLAVFGAFGPNVWKNHQIWKIIKDKYLWHYCISSMLLYIRMCIYVSIIVIRANQ